MRDEKDREGQKIRRTKIGREGQKEGDTYTDAVEGWNEKDGQSARETLMWGLRKVAVSTSRWTVNQKTVWASLAEHSSWPPMT